MVRKELGGKVNPDIGPGFIDVSHQGFRRSIDRANRDSIFDVMKVVKI
jgi:hypothetical protein